MIINVTEYLENSADKYADKVAVVDKTRKITYRELRDEAKHIGMGIIASGAVKKPVIVYLDKSVECIAAFFGTVYSGNFYSPLDTDMPLSRIEKIINTLQPEIIITDAAHKEAAKQFA